MAVNISFNNNTKNVSNGLFWLGVVFLAFLAPEVLAALFILWLLGIVVVE